MAPGRHQEEVDPAAARGQAQPLKPTAGWHGNREREEGQPKQTTPGRGPARTQPGEQHEPGGPGKGRARAQHEERSESGWHGESSDSSRSARPGQRHQPDRPNRADRLDHPGQPAQSDHLDRPGQPDQSGQSDQLAQAVQPEQIEQSELAELSDQGVDLVFAALADSTRRQVLQALSQGRPLSASALAADFPVSRQAVAQHLLVLQQAGLVESRRSGREVLFNVRPEGLMRTASWMTTLAETWSERLQMLKRIAESTDKED